MLCLRYRRLLIPYVECELTERARAKLEAHVSRCPSCARELALIRSVSGVLRSAESPAMEPAPDLWAKVSARIEREAPFVLRQAQDGLRTPFDRLRTKGTWVSVTQAVSACAAAVLVAAVGINLMRPVPPAEAPSKPSAPVVAKAPEGNSMPASATRVEKSKPKTVPRVRRPVTGSPVRKPSSVPPLKNVAAVSGGREVATPVRVALGDSVRTAAVSTTDRPVALYARSARNTASSDAKRLNSLDARLYRRAAANASGEAGLSFGGRVAKPAEPVRMAIGIAPAPAAAPPHTVAASVHYFSDRAAVAGPAPDVGAAKNDVEGLAMAAKDESVVDELNKTEGVRLAALFSYP